MRRQRLKGTLYDGRYHIRLAYSDEIGTDSGKYISPGKDTAADIIVNPTQPEFDRDQALMHEINHHIAWTRGKRVFVGHDALDYHATALLSLLRNSPRLAEHFHLFHERSKR